MKSKDTPFARMSQRTQKYATYTSAKNMQNHPNREYPETSKTMMRLEDRQRMAETIIAQDYLKGPDNIKEDLNKQVNKYDAPTIFSDSNRQRFLPTHYREGYNENINKILNNNTSLRIFDRHNPARPDIKPLLNQNIAGIRPKECFLTYEADNPGILKRNKSQRFRKVLT